MGALSVRSSYSGRRWCSRVSSVGDMNKPVELADAVSNTPTVGRAQVVLPRNQLGETSESLELLKCADFVGPPGSGAPLSQPFSVAVSQQVRRQGPKQGLGLGRLLGACPSN